MRRHRLLGLLVPLAILAAACGSDDDSTGTAGTTAATDVVDTTDAATTVPATNSTEPATTEAPVEDTKPIQASGKLVYYSLQPSSATDILLAEFAKVQPDIDVEVVHFQGPDILDRIGAEAQAGVNAFDVVDMAGRSPLAPFSEQGLLAKYEPQALSNFDTKTAASIADPDKWVFAANSHGLCYNSDVIDPAPTSYQDLLDPRFKGEIVYGAPLGTGFGQTLTVETKGFWGEETWTQFWEGLGQQDVLIVDSPATSMDALTRGERGVALWCNASALRAAQQKGAPIEWVTVEPNIANEVAVAMAAKAPNPDAAKAFIEFILSPAGQGVVGEAFGLLPVLPGSPPPAVTSDAMDIAVVLTPSDFAKAEAGGLADRDPNIYADYVTFIKGVFGLS